MDPGNRGTLPASWRVWLREVRRCRKLLRPGSEDWDVCRLRKRKDGGGFAADLAVVTDETSVDETLTAESAGVFPLDGGNAVFAQDVFERRNPASTTKVMTALIALKYGNLDDVVTVPQESVITESGSSMAGVVPGDKLTLEQLLYGLLIPSGNDAAMLSRSTWADPSRAL